MDEEKSYVAYCQQLFQGICRGTVEVERSVDDRGTLLSVRIGKGDMPAAIGRGGSNITAIRTLVNAAGKAAGEKVSVKVIEPEGNSGY